MLLTSEHLLRELIRLIVAEPNPKNRKALSEKLERLLKQEPKAFDAR